jgi:ribosomal protein L3 glutamine methyltransferase
LEVARINIGKHEAESQVRAVCSDLFSALEGKRYDLIVSNPPYVNSEEWRNLPPEYHAEPRLGLESGESGLECVRRILRQAEAHLKPDGLLIVEVGSSAEALEYAYPEVPFCWIDFERGGDGVFLLTAEQLAEYRAHCAR